MLINVSGCSDLGPHCITNSPKSQDPPGTLRTGTMPLDSVIPRCYDYLWITYTNLGKNCGETVNNCVYLHYN